MLNSAGNQLRLLISSVIIVIILFTGCRSDPQQHRTHRPSPQKKTRIIIQPLGRVDMRKVTLVNRTLSEVFDSVEIRPAINIPASHFYRPRSRYRADSIIKWLSMKAATDEVYLGITSEDISCTKGKNPDSGVMGLGFQPGKACVISDFRLRQKNRFPVLALHELGHNFDLPHCNHTGCFMMDAKGTDHTRLLKDFCQSCKPILTRKGWKL